jgi:methyl-accepting chemotaxis protein WspA
MFDHLSIKNKLTIGFGAILAIILVLLILAYNNFARLSEANGWDRHTLEVLLETDQSRPRAAGPERRRAAT